MFILLIYFVTQSKDEEGNYQEYRPMTAISIPIFNKKRDEFNKVGFYF